MNEAHVKSTPQRTGAKRLSCREHALGSVAALDLYSRSAAHTPRDCGQFTEQSQPQFPLL